MNVGLVIHRFDPNLGGAEQWTWQFARWLQRAGHQVHIVAGSFAAEAQGLHLTLHRAPQTRARCQFADNVDRLLQGLPLEIVHDTGVGCRCDVFQPHGGARAASFEQNLLLLPRWQRPIKRAVAPLLPRYREMHQLARRQYAHDGRVVVAISRMVARDIARHHGWPADRMRVVYNGVDAEKFSPHLRHTLRAPLRLRLGLRNERLLLIVAHNFELKGVPALLRATALLVQDGRPIHLAVVGGKPSALPAYRRAAWRLGIDAAVTFAGPVADAAPWYAAADVYVQPTFYDPCSLVVLEALACGLPVITSRYNGAGELLNEGVEGFVLDDPSDDRRLAERIELLLDDELREHMARQARRRALRCTFDHNGQAIVDVYHQVKAATRRAA